MSKVKIIKRTIGVGLLFLLFVVWPIMMALDENDPVGQFIGQAWLSLWLLVGLVILTVWLFSDE